MIEYNSHYICMFVYVDISTHSIPAGKCGISESHRLTEQGDVPRPKIFLANVTTTGADEDSDIESDEDVIDLDLIDLDDEDNVENDDEDDDDENFDIDDEEDLFSTGDDNSDAEDSSGTAYLERHKSSKRLVLSAALMCAVRVSVMNETDVDLLCPRARGAWDDHKCEEEIFNEYQPVDRNNEMGMIEALRSSILALESEYDSTIQEDETLLSLSSFGPATRSAIILRIREKKLLKRALIDLEQWEALLQEFDYQLTAIKQRREELHKEAAERDRIRKQAILEFKDPAVVVSLSLGDADNTTLTVREGEDLNARLKQFGFTHKVDSAQLSALKEKAWALAAALPVKELSLWKPIIMHDSNLTVLSVRKGDTINFAVQVFIAVHNLTLTPAREAQLTTWISEHHRVRQMRRVLASQRFTAPDGRILQVELRQGDQHNVASAMRHWAAAVRMPSGVVPQLVTALESKLSPALLQMPVDVPAKAPLMLRISRGDNLDNGLA